MGDAIDLSCAAFVAALASKAPAPGGGGAAALVGAIGTALGNMVGSLTAGKPRYADVAADIAELDRRAAGLEAELLGLVAADAEAFEPLARAYGLPAGTALERAHKAEVMEECLRAACEVPLRIMRACCEAIELVEGYAAKGSVLARSDAGCAAVCCKAALQAASLNVRVNTASMTDRAQAAERDARAREMLAEYGARADAVLACVEEGFVR